MLISNAICFKYQLPLLIKFHNQELRKPLPNNKLCVSKSKAGSLLQDSPPNIMIINKNNVAIAPT